MTQQCDVKGKGFFKLFLGLFSWLMKKSSCNATNNELDSLKKFCEGQSDAAAD